jgi:hypothetical protein
MICGNFLSKAVNYRQRQKKNSNRLQPITVANYFADHAARSHISVGNAEEHQEKTGSIISINSGKKHLTADVLIPLIFRLKADKHA